MNTQGLLVQAQSAVHHFDWTATHPVYHSKDVLLFGYIAARVIKHPSSERVGADVPNPAVEHGCPQTQTRPPDTHPHTLG